MDFSGLITDEDVATFFAGMGDAMSFGLGGLIRDALGGNELVNKCSRAYRAGEITGMAVSMAATMGASAEGSAAARLCSLCFAPGTEVHTARGPLPIEQVRVGDWVWSEDPERNATVLHQVTQVLTRPDRPLFEVSFRHAEGQRESIDTTSDHPFWTRRGWIPAEFLRSGDLVLARDGGWSTVVGARGSGRHSTVYSFEVEGDHTFFVGEHGVLVHNACGALRFTPDQAALVDLA